MIDEQRQVSGRSTLERRARRPESPLADLPKPRSERARLKEMADREREHVQEVAGLVGNANAARAQFDQRVDRLLARVERAERERDEAKAELQRETERLYAKVTRDRRQRIAAERERDTLLEALRLAAPAPWRAPDLSAEFLAEHGEAMAYTEASDARGNDVGDFHFHGDDATRVMGLAERVNAIAGDRADQRPPETAGTAPERLESPDPRADQASEAAAAYIEAFAANYPEDVFPPIDGVIGHISRDRVGACMARHLCQVLAADLRRGLHVGGGDGRDADTTGGDHGD